MMLNSITHFIFAQLLQFQWFTNDSQTMTHLQIIGFLQFDKDHPKHNIFIIILEFQLYISYFSLFLLLICELTDSNKQN